MAPGRGVGAAIYRGGVNSRPSDQTDLKGWRRCNLGGDGELTYEGEPDRWGPHASQPRGGAGRPPISASARSLVGCLLDGSRVFQCQFHRG